VSGTGLNPTATDNCTSQAPVTFAYTLSGATSASGTGSLSGVTFNLGATTVTWIATDGAGRKDTCIYIIQVEDNQLPSIVECGAGGNQSVTTQQGECTYTQSGSAWDAIVTDNCTVSTLGYLLTGTTTGSGTGTLNGVSFQVGLTTVTWTATDNEGNSSSCSFTVNVTDNQAPIILTCGSGKGEEVFMDLGMCSYTHSGLSWNPVTFDNCVVPSVSYQLSGATTGSGTSLDGVEFQGGLTTVTWIVTDYAGNATQCSFTVNVADNQNPVILNCPEDIQSCETTVTWRIPVITDNCPGMVISSNYQPGAVFPIGANTVTYVAVDASGNRVSCSFQVVVATPELTMVSSNSPCFGDNSGMATVIVSQAVGPFEFIWSNGSTDSLINGLASGTYSVTVTVNNGCATQGEVTITEPTALEATVESVVHGICGFEPGNAQINTTGGTQPYVFDWNNGQASEDLFQVSDGLYQLTVTDENGCQDTLSVLIDCIFGEVPNLVTPNFDDMNDRWIIPGLEKMKDSGVEIYNRWGNEVFRAYPYNNDWDGKSSGMLTAGNDKLPAGTYFYIVKLDKEGKKILTGYLELQY
jgi:gliding motility-associated-like protein